MEKKDITIKNISNREVGIVVHDMKLSRFIKPGMKIKMPVDKLEEALTYPGVPELFNSQYLVAEDQEAMEEIAGGYVNLPEQEEEKLSESEIINLLQKGTDFQLDRLLKSSTEYRKDTIVSAALKCENITFSKLNLISKATGKDIFKMKKQLNS